MDQEIDNVIYRFHSMWEGIMKEFFNQRSSKTNPEAQKRKRQEQGEGPPMKKKREGEEKQDTEL